MMKETFHGEEYKVQLQVFDLTGESVPADFRKDKPNFCVTTLPITAHPSTPFSHGNQAYYGRSCLGDR